MKEGILGAGFWVNFGGQGIYDQQNLGNWLSVDSVTLAASRNWDFEVEVVSNQFASSFEFSSLKFKPRIFIRESVLSFDRKAVIVSQCFCSAGNSELKTLLLSPQSLGRKLHSSDSKLRRESLAYAELAADRYRFCQDLRGDLPTRISVYSKEGETALFLTESFLPSINYFKL